MAGDSQVAAGARRFGDDRHHGAPPRGARQLTAFLPNGRTLWLRVAAPLAPATAVTHVAQLAESVAERHQSTTVAQVGALERLSGIVAADAGRIEAARLARAGALRRRIVAGDNAADVRLAKARDEFRTRLDRQLKIDRESLRRLRRRDLWDKILIGSSLPLFAAYGERDDPFGSNNLTLTACLLIWLVGDQVVEAVFGSDAAKSPYALDDADAWSYIAPFANLLAGWWLLSDRQHERFVTGMATLKLHKRKGGGTLLYRGRANVDLTPRIGKDYVPDFVTFTGMPAVASICSTRLPEGGPIALAVQAPTATVEDGILKLTIRAVPTAAVGPGPLPADHGEIDVAWMVDTSRPSTPPPAK